MTLDIKAVRAVCDAATPGPWRAHSYGAEVQTDSEAVDEEFVCQCYWEADRITGGTPQQFADAAFIALARTALPQALDELELARAEIASLQEKVNCLRDEV